MILFFYSNFFSWISSIHEEHVILEIFLIIEYHTWFSFHMVSFLVGLGIMSLESELGMDGWG